MSLPPVKVSVVAGGVAETKKALRSIADEVDRLEKRAIQTQERGSASRVRVAKKESTDRVRAARSGASEEERIAKHMQSVRERSSIMAGRFAAKQVADEIRLEQQKTRAIEREIAKQSAIRQRQQTAFAKGITRRIGSDIGGLARGATSMLAGAVGIGGGFALADALRYNLRAQSAATSLDIASGGAVTKQQALAASRKTSSRLGIDQTDVIKGIQAFVGRTGDGKEGLSLVDFMADVAKSQDVDIGEIGKAMGQARVQNKSATTEELKQLMLSAVAQGKAGSVEIGDMASALVKATASKSEYGGNSVANMKKLAGLTQIAMVGSSDAEMAGTAVAHLSTDIKREEKHWNAAGINVRDASGKFLDDPVKLLQQMVVKTGGSSFAQAKLLGERSKFVATGMNDVFNEAEKNQKGSGAAALQKYVDNIMKQQMTAAELQEDLMKKLQDPAEALSRAFNTLKMQLGDKLAPHMDRFIAKLPQIVESIMKLVDKIEAIVTWAADNPFSAVVAAITVSLAKAVGSEIVSKAVAGAVARVIAGSAAGGIGGGGGLGVVGGLAGGAAVAAAGGLIYGAAQGIDATNQRVADANYDPSKIIKWASKGDKNGLDWIAQTRDEGTGLGGDALRSLKAMGHMAGIAGGTLTDFLGITKGDADAHRRSVQDIATRSGIAYELENGNTPEAEAGRSFIASEIKTPRRLNRAGAEIGVGETAHISSGDALMMEALKAEADAKNAKEKEAFDAIHKEQLEAAKQAGIVFGQQAADALRENITKNPLPTNGQPVDPGGGR